MNRREAKQIVYHLTARSLRTLAKSSSRWGELRGFPRDLTRTGENKVKSEMLELADKLEKKYPIKEAIDVPAAEEDRTEPAA